MKRLWAVWVFCGMALLGGCATGGSNSSSGSSGVSNPAQTASYILTTIGAQRDAILAFGASSNGNLDPGMILGPVGINLPTNAGVPEGESAIATDAAGNLYVLASGPVVLVYTKETSYPTLSNSNGTPAPARTMRLSFPGSYVVSLATDTAGNLYVGSYSGSTFQGEVSVYAASGSGSVSPTRTITGTQTGMLQVRDLAVDSSGNIYVVAQTSTSGQSAVQVFGPTASGNVAPTRTITNATSTFESVTILPNGNAAVTAQPYTPSTSASNAIMEFSPSATGAATPANTITVGASVTSGVTTDIRYVRADSAGYLYVLTQVQSGGDASTISTYAPNATGSAAPYLSFTTITMLGSDGQIALQ